MTNEALSKLIESALEHRKDTETAGDVLTRVSEETGEPYERLGDIYADLKMGIC